MKKIIAKDYFLTKDRVPLMKKENIEAEALNLIQLICPNTQSIATPIDSMLFDYLPEKIGFEVQLSSLGIESGEQVAGTTYPSKNLVVIDEGIFNDDQNKGLCNFTCAHCCFSANGRGTFMRPATLWSALLNRV